jgi:hypothetical protein
MLQSGSKSVISPLQLSNLPQQAHGDTLLTTPPESAPGNCSARLSTAIALIKLKYRDVEDRDKGMNTRLWLFKCRYQGEIEDK